MTTTGRRVGLVGLVVLALAAFAAWLSWGRPPGVGTADEARRGAGRGSESDLAAGGVGARQATAAGLGRVGGDVVDDDGAPLSGGRVLLRCLTPVGDVRPIEDGNVDIDEDGHFEGPGCQGQVCAELHHAGYVAAEPWVLPRGDTPTLVARPLGRIYGEVRDGGGEPVVDAKVTAVAVTDTDPTAVLPLTTAATSTDADGAFSYAWIERAPCDPCLAAQRGCDPAVVPSADAIDLHVRASGHGPATVRVDLGEYDDEMIVVTLAAPASPISGTLVDPQGEPYPRAFLLARSEARPSEQQRVEPDAGAFSFDGLGAGAYTVRAIQDGVELARAEGVQVGGRLTLTGPAQRDLLVEVVDEDGAALPEASVRGGPFDRAHTDEAGRVSATGVAEGDYTLRIRPRRMPTRLHTVHVGDADDAPAERTPTGAQIVRIRATASLEQ